MTAADWAMVVNVTLFCMAAGVMFLWAGTR